MGTLEVEINKERAEALRKSKKDLDALPLTQDALIPHIRPWYEIKRWNHVLLSQSLKTANGTKVETF